MDPSMSTLTSVDKDLQETKRVVALLEAAQGTHEAVCAERWLGARADLKFIKGAMAWAASALVTVALGMLAYFAHAAYPPVH